MQVTIPLELTSSPFTGSRENETTHRLQGVIEHRGGTLHSGHYVAYCRAHTGSDWVLYDDDRVSMVGYAVKCN